MNLAKVMFFEKGWNILVRDYLLAKDLVEKGELLARKDALEEQISKEMKLDPVVVKQRYAQKFSRFCETFHANNDCQPCQQGIKRKREDFI